MKYTITTTCIYVEWNDNPKMEVVMNEMPSDLAQAFDDWLSSIEKEQEVLIGEVKDESKNN